MAELTAAEAAALACQRIEANYASKSPILDLGDLPLESLPESIGKLDHLRVLGLGKHVPRLGEAGVRWEYGPGRPNQVFRSLGPLAGLTALTTLNLSGCEGVGELGPLAGLTALTTLGLSGCKGVRELGPLAGLTALATLSLSGCEGVGELGPLAGLTALTTLTLSGCHGIRQVQPIRGLLRHLDELYLYGCSFLDLPAHLYGADWSENVAEPVRRHFVALATQRRGEDVECKLLVVGNGAAGKTSLVHLILEEPHQDDEPTTHGIHLGVWQTDLHLEGSDAPVPARVNIWDFGGQDLYHETHRLFFQSGAVYLVVWDPWEAERPDQNAGDWYTDKKGSLQYWIDQLVAVDRQARILVVRNKADLDGGRVDPDWRERLPRHQEAIADGRIQFVRLSAKDRSRRYQAERGKLFAWLAGAVAAVLGGPEKRAAGKGRLAVKEVVRGWQAANDTVVRANETAGGNKQPLPYPFVTRAGFDAIVRQHCAGSPDADDTSYVLQWLHRTGVLYWNEALFGERVLIDQRWAIQGIYTLLDREVSYPRLQPALGRFTAAHLARWAWDAAGYSPEEQRLFLKFMQSCGLCFLLLKAEESAAGQAVYVAPDYLPGEDNPSVADRRAELRRGLGDEPAVEVCTGHPGLGEGVARALMNQVGAKWSRSAVLWRWGAAFASGDPKVHATAEARWSPFPGQELEFGGRLRVAAWGRDAAAFLELIVATIRRIPAFPSEATFGPCGDDGASLPPDEPVVVRGRGPSGVDGGGRRDLPGIDQVAPSRNTAVGRYVSFSVAGTKGMPPAEARLQECLLEQLKARAAGASYRLIHYRHEPEDLPEKIDALMQEIACGDLVLVFLGERYLLSKFCMTELVLIYDQGRAQSFPRDQAKLWRLPSARRHLDSEQPTGRGVSKDVIQCWRQQLSAFDQRTSAAVGEATAAREVAARYHRMKQIDPCWPLFEMLGDDTRWHEFVTALTTHAFENAPLTGGNEDVAAVEAFAARTAEEIHRRMTDRGAARP